MSSTARISSGVPAGIRATMDRVHIPAVNMSLKAAVAAGLAYQAGLAYR